MDEHEVVIRMKFKTSHDGQARKTAEEMRHAIASYWSISQNSKHIEALLDGAPVPKVRIARKRK